MSRRLPSRFAGEFSPVGRLLSAPVSLAGGPAPDETRDAHGPFATAVARDVAGPEARPEQSAPRRVGEENSEVLYLLHACRQEVYTHQAIRPTCGLAAKGGR